MCQLHFVFPHRFANCLFMINSHTESHHTHAALRDDRRSDVRIGTRTREYVNVGVNISRGDALTNFLGLDICWGYCIPAPWYSYQGAPKGLVDPSEG